MENYECWNIKGRWLEFYNDDHTYFVDGVPVKSITQILHGVFPSKYSGIDKEVLNKAAQKGTAVHEAIEDYCKTGTEADLPEVRGFKTLQRLYKFEVLENEVPIILEDRTGDPIAAGRLDLVISIDGKMGGADIKRTSVLDKEYLAYQLNLYRIAYEQSYGKKWEFLRGLHLRNDVRKFVELPIKEEYFLGFIEGWKANER